MNTKLEKYQGGNLQRQGDGHPPRPKTNGCQPLTSANHQGGEVHWAHHQHRQEADHQPQRQHQQPGAEGHDLERPHMGAQGQGDPPRGHMVHPGNGQWIQHHHQTVQALPHRMLVHPLQRGAGHPQQEAGDLLQLPAQGQADSLPKRSCGRDINTFTFSEICDQPQFCPHSCCMPDESTTCSKLLVANTSFKKLSAFIQVSGSTPQC